MFFACLKVQFYLPGCRSLKEKRYVLESLKSRLKNRFNVSFCETDYQNKWQRSEFALATVAVNRKGIDRVSQDLRTFFESDHRIVILEWENEVY